MEHPNDVDGDNNTGNGIEGLDTNRVVGGIEKLCHHICDTMMMCIHSYNKEQTK